MFAEIKKHLGELKNKYAQARFVKIALFSKRGSLLDVGGYTGELRNFLYKGHDYYLIDRDEEAKLIPNGRVVDLQNEDISRIFDFKFDNVVTSCMLDIVFDPDSLVSQIKKVLKKDGLFIVSIDNDNTILHRLRVLFGYGINKTPFNIYYHLRHPTFKQWAEFFERHGFKRKDITYTICFNKEKPIWFDKVALFFANLLPNLFARGAVAVYENSPAA